MHIYDYTMKQYKPGQFVSINGKLARVTQATNPSRIFICEECKVRNKKLTCICKDKDTDKCVDNLPHNCYPKLIKQCKQKK